MSRSDGEIVRESLRTALEGTLPDLYAAISEDFLIHSSTGHLYVGHEGFREWLKRARSIYDEHRFELEEVRELGGGAVLLVGILHNHPRRGIPEAQPGAWLVHVREQRLSSLIFFRTVEAALAALSDDTPQTRLNVVEKLIDAFNRGDHAAVLGAVGSDHRFVSPSFEGVEFQGHFDAADVLESMRERYDEYTIESHRVTDLGDGFLALDTVARARLGGETTHYERTWLIRIERGLLREATFHDDLEAARAAFEQRTAPPASHPSPKGG